MDRGLWVKVSLLGGDRLTVLKGRLVGFDAYNIFIEQAGVVIDVFKSAIRYLHPIPPEGG